MNNVIDMDKYRKTKEAWHDLWEGELAEEMTMEFIEMLQEDKEAARETEDINQAMLRGEDSPELSQRITVLQLKACHRAWSKLVMKGSVNNATKQPL